MKKIRSKVLDKLTPEVLEKTDNKNDKLIRLPNDEDYYHLKNVHDIVELEKDIIAETQALLNQDEIIAAKYTSDYCFFFYLIDNSVIEFECPVIKESYWKIFLPFDRKSNYTFTKCSVRNPSILVTSNTKKITPYIRDIIYQPNNLEVPDLYIDIGSFECGNFIFKDPDNNLQILMPSLAFKYIYNYHKDDFNKYVLDNDQAVYKKYKSTFDYYNDLSDEEKLMLQLNMMNFN